MKNLQFCYKMQIDFDTPIQKHRFTIKFTPVSTRRQKIEKLHIDVYPKEFLSTDEDSFGNICIFGYCEQQHNQFYIDVEGQARTGLSHYETAADQHRVGMYRYTTKYTIPGDTLKEYHRGFHFRENTANYARALHMMEQLYRDFSYVQGATTIATTAEQAMALGKGVCQDYSHILIALCHMEHIPARYVVGMLEGEGLSHAWVEIYENGMWIGLDPTNNLVVADQHIKVSNGRDYGDCTINQGIFTGAAAQTQTALVLVEEIKE